MQKLIYITLLTYFVFYLFEGPIRYGLSSIGGDSLIFIRDIILILSVLIASVARRQSYKTTHPAFIVFALLMLVHGAISFLNIKSMFVVVYSIKSLFTILAGVILAPYLLNPPKMVVRIFFALWIITFFGVFIDKYDIIAYPWTGLQTTIGDIQVDITKDWTVTGFDKRAGGLMRSSINVALIAPLLALILLFNIRSLLPRLAVIVMTVVAVYWSTQKASIVAFIFTCALLFMAYKRPVPALKIGITLALILMVALPIILPQFTMPSTKGTFSLESFYLRVEDMWPRAWLWIERREIFPFGVGLGGIGGAMRFYAMEMMNAADNMFIFLYAFFGVFSFLYLGWLWWACMRVSNKPSPATAQALSIILFICFYGVALSMIEDMMASLFLGAAIGWVGGEALKRMDIKYK